MSRRRPGLGRGLDALIPRGGGALGDSDAENVLDAASLFCLINTDGSVNERLPISLEDLRGLYADMVEARVFDTKAAAMQRQGRLATYSPFRGQEGAQVGAAAALRPDDWVAATYRDAALNWRAGYPWHLLMAGRTGDERGGQLPDDVNVLPPSITVGGHMIHAVGLGWAELAVR